MKRVAQRRGRGGDREIGGTVGDIESLPFLEAIRQMRHEQGRENCIFVHVTLVPWIAAAQELKTKPTQHSVKELRAIGIQPDILICRSERFHRAGDEGEDRAVLRRGCGSRDHRARREVGLRSAAGVRRRGRGRNHAAAAASGCQRSAARSERWTAMLERMQNPRDEVDIALVGKYVEYEDSYKSLKEALLHGGLAHNVKVNIHWIEAEGLVARLERELEGYDGILVPGGFGKRGIEGMINAIRYARERKVPYFGICLGMQTMVIEFARNVCGLDRRGLHRVQPAAHPHRVIYKLRELKGVDELGGTMRLGSWPCVLKPKAASRASLRNRARSASATATATNSIASSKKC
jgi:CTP synthase